METKTNILCAVFSYAMFTRTPRASFFFFFFFSANSAKASVTMQALQGPTEMTTGSGWCWSQSLADARIRQGHRVKWRSANKRVAQQFEDSRVNTTKEKRKHRKESANQATSCSNQTLPYPTCSRICKSRIGLVSHQRACRWSSEYEESAIIISSSSTFIVVVVFSRNYAVTDFLVCDKT